MRIAPRRVTWPRSDLESRAQTPETWNKLGLLSVADYYPHTRRVVEIVLPPGVTVRSRMTRQPRS